MFFLQILLPSSNSLAVDDILGGSHHALGDIVELPEAVCHAFLKKYHFRPRALAQADGAARPMQTAARSGRLSTTQSHLSTEPRASRPCRGAVAGTKLMGPGSPFDEWHRVKVG